MVPAPVSLDVGLGIKQNTTTGQNNRAYQAGGSTTAANANGASGGAATAAANIKAAQAELEKFAKIEKKIRDSLKGTGLQNSVRFQVTDRGLTVAIIADDVFFASASADLRPKGIVVLQSVGPVLAPLPNDISVEGNANNLAISSAIYPSNWELSGARASSVVRYLIANDGFDADPLVGHRVRLLAAALPGVRPAQRQLQPPGRPGRRDPAAGRRTRVAAESRQQPDQPRDRVSR